jgi:hypothetical protein
MRRWALAVVGAMACARVRDPSVERASACTLHGEQLVYRTESLFSAAADGYVLAHFNDAKVALRMWDLAGPRARVEVRSPPKGPAFVLRGFMAPRSVQIVAASDIAAVDHHAWIRTGTVVKLGPDLRVSPLYGPFPELQADAPCAALGLTAHPDQVLSEEPPMANGTPVHAAGARLTLRDEAGARLYELAPSNCDTFSVIGTRGELSHIIHDQYVGIDAWVNTRELTAGEGADCDDRFGEIRDVNDRCPDTPADVEASEGCSPVLATVVRRADIHVEPTSDSAVIGSVEKDLVVAIDPWTTSPWAQIRLRDAALDPGAHPFWVERAALHPRPH